MIFQKQNKNFFCLFVCTSGELDERERGRVGVDEMGTEAVDVGEGLDGQVAREQDVIALGPAEARVRSSF